MNNDKRMKQLRRRMGNIDWVWLSTCMGVVEGDSNLRTTSYVASKLAVSIRRQIALSVRQWKGGVNVCYLSEDATYTLPLEI